MGLETAADLAGMFDESEFAQAAFYIPAGGAARQVSAIVKAPDKSFDLGALGLSAPQRVAWVRKSEIEAPKAGDVIEAGAENLTIKQAQLDETGQIWMIDLAL